MINVVISCEHASNTIPKHYAPLFKGKQRVLKSHRGWDMGAEKLALILARELSAALFRGQASRLLVDLNRSLHHPGLFSEFTNSLDDITKEKIIDRYYLPYRDAIEKHIRQAIAGGSTVIHLSVHSFTPELNGKVRNADLGLLYDPARDHEKPMATLLQKELLRELPALRIRRNYPYKGTDDGFTTSLRRQFTESSYLGIEFELNQKHVSGNSPTWKTLQKKLPKIIHNTLRKQALI